MQEVKKVVIIGPESTGKSTLCQQLAEHYETLWCPEFARDFLMKNGTNYTFDDLLLIAKGQQTSEKKNCQSCFI
jgi:nicotinamide riboside kinase